MPEAEIPANGEPERLVPDVVKLVTSALDVGAAVARSLAQATTDEQVPRCEDRPPLEEMVRLGATAAGNLAGLIVKGARSGLPLGRLSSPVARSSERGSRPRVTAGSTLRVPLLVENSGDLPTSELRFTVASITRKDADAASALDDTAVSFTPESLVVHARDFEKLTVRIATSAETPSGGYEATIVGGDGWFTTVIAFDVVSST